MFKFSYKTGLPQAISNKIYKTGQTRGAENDEIYQNRVLRNSTVLIPYSCWNNGNVVPPCGFENGYIVLISPEDYFNESIPKDSNLVLGENLLVFYETRKQWNDYNPEELNWSFATSRTPPLNGYYVARIPDTTSKLNTKIRRGFTSLETGGKGAGIRFYEYASKDTIKKAYYQLAYLAWHTEDIRKLCQAEGIDDISPYVNNITRYCIDNNLINKEWLELNRLMLNNKTICPLCLEPISAIELSSRAAQVDGRQTVDLTVTKANLFHNKELRPGEYNHKVYNLGWGHYHCNTVVRDIGITDTLAWMLFVLKNNKLIY